ncbi:lymphocyte function-associated antigen 3 isoform X3 [Columba livia]|uniref:lymphocyte function-associated antigen 3 isoform X3 n=1 Tax=Columba livia TaxID=8932 RepID=UPI0031BADB69
MRLPTSLGGLLFLMSLLAHIHCEDVFGVVGENFTFPLKIGQKIVEILWTKNKHKVAEWEGQNETTYYDPLKNRGFLSKENGSLTIFNLENSDAGTYVLDYMDSLKRNHVVSFVLSVLAPPSEPEISCNISGDGLLLRCTADFQKPLNYSWKFSSVPSAHQTQEVFIPKEKADDSEKVTCFIKFSQTEKNSEISLAQCYPDEKGYSYHKRSRVFLTACILVPVFLISVVAMLVPRCKKGRTKLGTGRAAQRNSPVHGSGEHQLLCHEDSQEQPNSHRDISKKENSSLLTKNADDCDVNEGEVTGDAEGGNGEHLSNSPSCSEDLKS